MSHKIVSVYVLRLVDSCCWWTAHIAAVNSVAYLDYTSNIKGLV